MFKFSYELYFRLRFSMLIIPHAMCIQSLPRDSLTTLRQNGCSCVIPPVLALDLINVSTSPVRQFFWYFEILPLSYCITQFFLINFLKLLLFDQPVHLLSPVLDLFLSLFPTISIPSDSKIFHIYLQTCTFITTLVRHFRKLRTDILVLSDSRSHLPHYIEAPDKRLIRSNPIFDQSRLYRKWY